MSDLVERIKSKRYILLGLVLGLIAITIPVILLVDDFVHDVILVPFAYYIWLGKIIIKALPQSCFLTLLIVLCFVIVIPSLRKEHRSIWKPQSTAENIEGQVAMWNQRLELLVKGSYSNNRFAYHVGHLVIQILVYEERLTTREVIVGLENKTLAVPDQVSQYVLMGIGSEFSAQRKSLRHRIKLWWNTLFSPETKIQTPDQQNNIDNVIQFIEEKLKITDG